jgi:hypothetical protein
LKLRRHATTIALVVAAVLLGAYLWLVDRGKVTDTERSLRAKNVLPAFRKDDATRIELRGPQGNVVLARDVFADGGDTPWRLEEPTQVGADAHAVDVLLGAFEFATRIRKVEDGAATGLDAPRLRGTLTMGKLVYAFAIGADAPTPPGAAYFQLEGEGTFVVGKELVQQLLQSADAYRERTVVPYLSIDLARMEIRGVDKGFAIERMDDLAFRLPDGAGRRASRAALDGVWLALSETRAESFLSDAEAERLTATPAVTITMIPRSPSRPRGELLLGAPCPGRPNTVAALRRSPTRASACVPAGVVPRLLTTEDALLDRGLFVARADEIEVLALAASPSGFVVDLARKGGGWQLRAPESRELAPDEADMATALVTKLARGQGTPSTATFGTPRARVTVVRVDTHAEEVVELSRDERGKALVRRVADGAVLEVDADLARALTPTLLAVRGRAVWTRALDGRPAKRLVTDCGGLRQELERGTTGWRFIAPAGFAADNAAAVDVADTFARLRAEAWVADEDDGSFGFAEARCSLSYSVEEDGGVRTERVLVGRDVEGGTYARVDAPRAPVFVAARALRDGAQRVLVDRSALSVDVDRVRSISLRRGGARFTVVRAGKAFVGPDGGLPEAPQRIADALATLRADEVVHVGPPRADEGFAAPTLRVEVEVDGDGGLRTFVFELGQATLRRDQKMYFARTPGVDATFVVARERVADLLDTW